MKNTIRSADSADETMQTAIVIDYQRLASEIADALSGLTVQLDGQTVGRLVAPVVSRELRRETQSKRYTT